RASAARGVARAARLRAALLGLRQRSARELAAVIEERRRVSATLIAVRRDTAWFSMATRCAAEANEKGRDMGERPGTSTTDTQCGRRDVIFGAGQAALAGIAATVATATPSSARAASTKGQECMTILYPNGADVHFDFDYYERTHIHNIMNAYGKSIS